MADELDTRTYFVEDGATTTVDRIFGHEAFPCPPTRGEVATCREAWARFQQSAPVRLHRAASHPRPKLSPLQRPADA